MIENQLGKSSELGALRLFLAFCSPYALPCRWSANATLSAVAVHALNIEEALDHAEIVSLVDG